jgi:autotransporter-associated beta strand protein
LTRNTNEFGGRTNFGMGANGDGWHDIEIRFHNGTGGAGPLVNLGWGNYFGFGISSAATTSFLGTDYSKPVDNGSMSLFRTTTVAKGNLDIDAGAIVNAGGLKSIGSIALGRSAAGGSAALNLTGSGAAVASDADSVNILGVVTTGQLNIDRAIDSLTVAQLNFEDAGSSFIKSGSGTMTVTGTSTGAGQVTVAGGTLAINGSLSGGTVTVQNSARLQGTGTIAGSVNLQSGSTIAPGSSPGVLTIDNLTAAGASTFSLEIGRIGAAPPLAGVDYDQLRVTSNLLDVNGATLVLQLIGDFIIGDIFTIVLNQGADPNPGSFAGFTNGTTFQQNGYEFQISYFDDPTTSVLETVGGRSVSLLVTIPEPGSLAAIAGGVSMWMGLRRFRRRRNH